MFTDQERNDIICALEIAAEQYNKDAEVMSQHDSSLERQFRDQAERAEKLIERLM